MTTMNTDLLPREGRVLCAVSGGIDSMYLLCRLRELGCDVAAAHYNHGLRGAEADRDEAFVRDFCESRDIPFLSERGDTRAFAAASGESIETAARTLRYDFLRRAAKALGAEVIATAHTADDNCETMLFHLARGTGLRGLGGIPPRRGEIVRPMLDVTRAEAEAYLREHGVGHVDDSTNARDDYTRNRLRHQAVPVLREVNPALERSMAQTVRLLRRDEEYLSALAERFVDEQRDGDSLPAPALLAQPWPVASRAVRRMAGQELSLSHVEAILKIARDGGVADVPGLRVGRTGERLVFGVKNDAPLAAHPVPIPGVTELPEIKMALICEKNGAYSDDVHKPFNTFCFNYENICGSIFVTARRPGDRYRPAGRGCTKSLKQLFLEMGVPAWERDRVPVLRDGAGILGVYGAGPAERAAAHLGQRDILRLEFVRR